MAFAIASSSSVSSYSISSSSSSNLLLSVENYSAPSEGVGWTPVAERLCQRKRWHSWKNRWKSYGLKNRWGDQDRAEELMYILSYLSVCFQGTPFALEIFLCQRAWTLSNLHSPDLFDKAPEICRHIVTFANFLAISPWQGVLSLLYSPRIRLFAHLSLSASIGRVTLSFLVRFFFRRYAMVTSTQSYEEKLLFFWILSKRGGWEGIFGQ